MKDLIETLKSSRNILLKAEGEAIEKWKNLPQSKEGLDLFLKFNIAEILYDRTSYFCTSNVDLVNRILKILGSNNKISKNGFSSRRNIVMAWDLVEDKIISFSMKNKWNILNLVPINPANIELLESILKDLLRRKAE